MSEPLFRKEVVEARQTRWLGAISLGQPPRTWLFTSLAVIVTASISAALFTGEYARRTRVAGQLVPSLGIATVVSPVAGHLADVRVQEGARVQAGDVLAVVSIPRATRQGGDMAEAAQRAIAERRDSVLANYGSQRRQFKAQADGLLAQMQGLRDEVAQVGLELRTRREQHSLAQQSLQRLEKLHDRRFVTSIQLQQQQAVVLAELGSIQALERSVIVLRRELGRLGSAHAELMPMLAAVDAAEKGDRSSLDQESLESGARAESVVRSPVSGTVGSLLGQSGQAVQAGQTMLSLLPDGGRLEAHLLVPSRAVGFVEPGDEVRLRYQSFPYQKFGHHMGKVARISRSALSQGELGALIGNVNGGEPHYRIVVELDRESVRAFGRDEALKPGMLLEADIFGETRSLWEWAIEPLLVLRNTVGST